MIGSVFLFAIPAGLAQIQAVNENPPENPGKVQTVTVELKGVNVIDVLDFFSKETGLNIVAGKGVEGQITLFLKDVEVRKALETVLETADLAMIEEGPGLVKILTKEEYLNRFGKPYYDRRELRSFTLHNAKATMIAPLLESLRSQTGKIMVDPRSNTIAMLDTLDILESAERLVADLDVPSVTRSFALRYSKAEDLEKKLKSVVTPETSTLEMDVRSNKIIVTDTQKKMQQIEEMVRSFDTQPLQVLIEARIVEVDLTDNARYGINWNLVFDNVGSLNGVNLRPNFSVTAPTGGTLTTATLGADNDDIQTVIQALEQFGKTNTLSSPRITVLNDEEAKLAVATREPFVTQTTVQAENTATTADNVQFIDVGVTMSVKPKITDDDYILLKIKPQVSSQGTPLELQGVASGSNTTFVRSRIPVVTSQEFETTVVVKSGHTIIIGGLIQDAEQKTMQKFPVLGDLPIIGAAFRSKTHNFSKTELVVFLTPRVVAATSQTQETKHFFNKKNQLLPFDEAGGYPFDKGIYQSQGPLRSDDKPYWRVQKGDWPNWFPSRDLNARPWDRYAGTEETEKKVQPSP